jgi:hypothetical protein
VSGVDQVRRLACHWLLLRLAGTAPDDLITQCRRWLGQERLLGIGRPVTYAVPSQHFLLANPDIDLLAELLAVDGADTSALSMVSVADFNPMPPCGFAPTRARSGAGQCAADQAPAVRAPWRSWQFPRFRAAGARTGAWVPMLDGAAVHRALA